MSDKKDFTYSSLIILPSFLLLDIQHTWQVLPIYELFTSLLPLAQKHDAIEHQKFNNHVSFHKHLLYPPSPLLQEDSMTLLKAIPSSLFTSFSHLGLSIFFQTFIFLLVQIYFQSPLFKKNLSITLFLAAFLKLHLPLNIIKEELAEAINDNLIT